MAIELLKTDYKDDQPVGERKYEITQNDDGTVGIKDVTVYAQIGDLYGALDINKTNTVVNELNSRTDQINNVPDAEKYVAYADKAGTASTANTASKAVSADSAITAKTVDNDFILINKEALNFNGNNVCAIADVRITEDSLADVYFTAETKSAAERAAIEVETYSGKVELIAGRLPEMTLKASIRIRVVES